MVRVKITKQNIFVGLITCLLFVIPFFWFKPGQMDLGGDSSRLYFLDPNAYLKSSTLSLVSPSSYGEANQNIVSLPYICLLIILKFFINSPTILIASSYGLDFSFGFLFFYLCISELISEKKETPAYIAGIVGGLLYIFPPALLEAWKHVLITYNQVFLNPLMFFLFLRYFKSRNFLYITIAAIITFIFSPNFSAAAAPAIFSFYPLSISFLMLYTIFILKKPIVVKHILYGFLLLLGLASFHLIPQLLLLFSKGSTINATVFTVHGKFDRGLSFFSAIVPNIKASFNLFLLPQMTSLNSFSKLFSIFPFIIIIPFLIKKSRTMSLTLFFFLIATLFATANITGLWLYAYKSFFSIPGFSMFRNFNGQWIYTFIFFYGLVFSQGLFIILQSVRKVYSYLLALFLSMLLLIGALPIIRGNVINEALWQSNNVSSMLKMDSSFAEAMTFVRALPADARVLTLPLTDPGYQIIAGEDGGAYEGPSTIAYLTGKKDFSSYDDFQDYKNIVAKMIRDDDTGHLKQMLGFLNIKYIFYNSDPRVYDAFPYFPYLEVRNRLLPGDQAQYKKFITSLNLKEVKNINNRYYIYELADNYFLPQIYVANPSMNINMPLADIQTPLLVGNSNRIAIVTKDAKLNNSKIQFDYVLNDIVNTSPLVSMLESTNQPLFDYPYSSWSIGSPLYPFIIQREKKELLGLQILTQENIDRRIFLAEKRISELNQWGNKAKLLTNVKNIDELSATWKEPNVLSALLFGKYNYWETNLVRYERGMYNLISDVEHQSKADPAFIANKNRIRKAVEKDRKEVYRSIESSTLASEQKQYLLTLAIKMFNTIDRHLVFSIPQFNTISYNIGQLNGGDYNVLFAKKSFQQYNTSDLGIVLNNKKISFDEFSQETDWFESPTVTLNAGNKNTFDLLLPQPKNLIDDSSWVLGQNSQTSNDAATLTVTGNTLGPNGLIRTINNWNEKAYYIISFDYLTHGSTFTLSLTENVKQKDQISPTITDDELISSDWKTYQTIIASHDDANKATLHVYKLANAFLDSYNQLETGQTISIKNLSVVEIPTPTIVFKKTTPSNQNVKPTITFSKINSAQYMVQIHNAITPYILVLMDRSNQSWELVDPLQNDFSLQGVLLRMVGILGNSISPNKTDVKMNILYSSNGVEQQAADDSFLSKNVFVGFGKKTIAGDKFFSVNGFSSGWYVEPKDVNSKKDYTLILEVSTQKYFFIALAVSLTTLLLVVLLFIKYTIFIRK